MGTVFLGRDAALDRAVAIKVLRPDLATATATERFLREARILASLNHPNVVAVHRAGESGGLSWYVMDYLPAETLSDRIARGPLPAAEATAVALDVLAALEAAHRRGVVHRDVKPANVFVVEGRAMLGDFGIASSAGSAGEPLTLPGHPLGTPDYMAPEQMVGKPATAASDLCGVGLILFEALTGGRYAAWESPGRADWSRVPRGLVPVLRRALALEPAARWSDAATFGDALRRVGRAHRVRRALWGAAGVSVAAAAVAWWLLRPPPPAANAAALQIVIQPFRASGAPVPPWFGDSLARALVHALGANTDFRVRPATSPADTEAGLVLEGRAAIRGERLDLAVDALRGAAGFRDFHADTTGTVKAWERTAADLAYQMLLQLWSRRNAAEAADLPEAAAPRTGAGLRAFLRAEQLFAHAQWDTAYKAYRWAREVDTTCFICDVRVADVGRWLGEAPDTTITRRYRARLDRFPAHYQALLRASFEPGDRRIRDLQALTDRAHDWAFAWFVLGDELFHRGPLAGYRRRDALEPLLQASVLRDDFAPVWEHLAWVAVAEGDSADAGRALERYARIASAGDPSALVIGGLIRTAYVWRFLPEPVAVTTTAGMLANPRIRAFKELRAAPSYMLSFEVPRATVWLGEQFAKGAPRRGIEEAGLLAQVYGLVALGRVDSALAVARRVAARTDLAAVRLFADELPAALALADSADIAAGWARLATPLQPMAQGAVRSDTLERARAAWMLALLAHRARRGADFDHYRDLVRRAGPVAAPLAQLLEAVAGPAGHGMPAAAVRRTDTLVALDSADRGGDPFFRMLLHVFRAGWQLGAGTPVQAVAELRWHENNDFVGYPGRAPQAAEVDYAFATLARWDRARLLESLGPAHREEACDVLAFVASAWRQGDPPFRERAEVARVTRASLGCASAP